MPAIPPAAASLLRVLALGLLVGLVGCTDIEGNEPGECEDGADNDLDGAFDCDDEQCAPSPVCQGATGCDCAGSVNPLETRPDAFALLLLWIVFLLKSRRAPPIMGQRRLPIHERRRKAVPRA